MKLFFLIFVIIFCFFILIFFSKFKINIKQIKIDTTSPKILKNYDISFGLYIFENIKLIGINVNEVKIKKIKEKLERSFIINRIANNSKFNNKKNKVYIEKLEEKLIRKLKNKMKNSIKNGNIDKKIIKECMKVIISKLKIETKKLNIMLLIGTEDILLTTYLVPIVAVIISFALKLTTEKINSNYSYKIEPIYNKNLFKLNFNCIVQLKLVHIINIIYILAIKKRRSDKYERASNRRYYGYSHE